MLDRFSSPLRIERQQISSFVLEELQERNKQNLVHDFIELYIEENGELPTLQLVQETYEDIFLDDTMVQGELEKAGRYYVIR
jgi:hypothetical protein